MSRKLLSSVAASALALGLATAYPAPAGADDGSNVKHVLLISIDGMHALDFANCRKGIAGINGGKPYCPNLAELGRLDGPRDRRLAAVNRGVL
jgi:hypothetical protein